MLHQKGIRHQHRHGEAQLKCTDKCVKESFAVTKQTTLKPSGLLITLQKE